VLPGTDDVVEPKSTPKNAKLSTIKVVEDNSEINIFPNDKSDNLKAGDGSSHGEDDDNSDTSSEILKVPSSKVKNDVSSVVSAPKIDESAVTREEAPKFGEEAMKKLLEWNGRPEENDTKKVRIGSQASSYASEEDSSDEEEDDKSLPIKRARERR